MLPRLISVLKHEDIVDALIREIEERRSHIDPYRKCDGVLEGVAHMMRCAGRNAMCDDIISTLQRLHEEAKQKDQATQ